MKIVVEMTLEEYDSYRAYQIEKQSLEREANSQLVNLRSNHDKLVDAILNSVEECGEGDDPLRYRIVNAAQMREAVTLANDWYC